jgi:hypothetical protein
MTGFAMTLVLMMSAYLSHATSPEPVSTISGQCSQASAKQAPVDLQAVVDEFVQSIPAADTAGYADPRQDPNGLNALVDGFTKVAGGNLVAACQALAPVNYRVTLTTDRTTARDVVLLRERRTQGRFARAWGFYLISWPPGTNPSTLIVEAPHTCPDTNVTGGCQGGDRFTHLVAVKVFQEATARYLFINGADRRANGTFGPTQCKQNSYCADMAHQPEGPFEKIHEKAVSGLGSQLHRHQHPSPCPDRVAGCCLRLRIRRLGVRVPSGGGYDPVTGHQLFLSGSADTEDATVVLRDQLREQIQNATAAQNSGPAADAGSFSCGGKRNPANPDHYGETGL